MRGWHLALAFGVAAAGCFSPSYSDGNLKCAAGATPCPDGYYCAATGYCWGKGHAPPRPTPHLSTANGGDVNVTAPGDHGISVSIGQPLVGGASAPGNHTVQLGGLRSATSN